MSGCQEAYIYSLFLVWGARRHAIKEKIKIVIYIYLYITYILNDSYHYSPSFPQPYPPVPKSFTSKSRKANQNLLHPFIVHDSRVNNASDTAPDISTSSLWFESRKLWTQHMTAPREQMVSWLTTQFTGYNCLVMRKLYSSTWKVYRKKEQVGKESLLCIDNVVTASEMLKFVFFRTVPTWVYIVHYLPNWSQILFFILGLIYLYYMIV